MKSVRKILNFLIIVSMALSTFAMATPASANTCSPPTASHSLEWWSVELGNHPNLARSDSGQITGLEPGTATVRVEAHSDHKFGCGTDQADETALVTVNGKSVTVTHNTSVGSTELEVEVGNDGVLNIKAVAQGRPGSMFVHVVVVEQQEPEPTPRPQPQLNISNIECADPNASSVNVHFVTVHLSSEDDISDVSYNITVPNGESVDSVAEFERVTGKTAHFDDNLVGYGNGTYVLTSASVVINGESVSLHNPGESFQVKDCEPKPTPEPEPTFRKNHFGSCERLNASMLNDSSETVMAEGTMRDKDGNVLGGNKHPLDPGPEAWFNVGADTPENYSGSFSWKIVFTDVDSGEKVAKFEGSDTVDCGEKPTPSPTPTATPTEEPTPSPTPTEPPEECRKEDFTAFFTNEGRDAVVKSESDVTCIAVRGVYNTHGHANLQEGPQTLIGFTAREIGPGETVTLTVPEYDPAESCFVQDDIMIVSSMDEVPPVVPETLTNENQGPQFAALILAVTRGNRVCEFEEPEQEELVTCPECGFPVWEEMYEGGLRSTVFSKGECTVCLETNRINVDSWLYVEGWDAGEWYVWYQGVLYEPSRRTTANGHEYSWVEIDLKGDDGNYVFLSKPLESITHLEQEDRYDHDRINEYVACSVAPGWQDTTEDGFAHFKDGHQLSDWAKFLMETDQVDSYEEGLEWAEQLREAGSLELPST